MRGRLTPIAIICALLVMFGQPANADTPRQKLARAQDRLDELSRDLEIQIEECNTHREQLKAVRAAVKQNRADYDRAVVDMAAVDDQRGTAVAAMYKQRTSGGQMETLASPARSLAEYAERVTLLDITAAARTSAFERYTATRDQLTASGEVLDATEEQAAQANTKAQKTCDETRRKVEAEEERVIALSDEVERLERQARARQDAGNDSGGSADSASAAPPAVSGDAAGAVAFALGEVGKPYQWGGSGPDSYDCSGLTSAAWAAAGTSLPHSSSMQYSATARVSRSAVQPGDLMFFGSPIHHVAMYIGNGQMVEAPRSGLNVRVVSADRSDFVGAGRP